MAIYQSFGVSTGYAKIDDRKSRGHTAATICLKATHMKDQFNYRHPRTLQEAFGPYTDNSFYEPVPKYTVADRVILALCILCWVLLPFAIYFEWI